MADAFFEIVILGTDLPGLAFGALCAKEGYTVLVVGQDARPATYNVGNALMFRSIPLFYGFQSSLVLRSFFRDIGLIAEMRNRPQKLDPFLQVVTPGLRFELSERTAGNREELERAFGGAAAELERFLSSSGRDAKEMDDFLEGLPLVPAHGFFARRRLSKYIAKHDVYLDSMQPMVFPSELRFSSPVTSLLLYLSRLHGKPFSPFAVRRLVQHVMGGFFEFPQGIDGMKRLFTDRIIANGGAYWPERSTEQILLKGKKQVEAVVVHRPRRTVGMRLLVGNCPHRPLLSLIPQEQQNPQFHGAMKAMIPAACNYVLNLAVKPDLIPESMGRHLLLSMYPKQETGGPNVLRVYCRFPDAHETDTPATLVVTCRIPTRELPLEKSQFDDLNQRIINSLEWVLPFLREKLILVHSPYIAADRETGEERLDPTEVQETYDEPFEGCLEFSALPARTCYKNFLLLGDNYLGGLGLEGSFMAARQAFAWTREKIVLKQILRK